MKSSELLPKLAEPFPPSAISWLPGSTTKDGNKCMAMAYADLRAYMQRLDEVCGLDWAVHYAPWEQGRIICELTLYIGDALGRREDITRSSTGEYSAQDEKNNIEGTVAEAQAFKRACAMFGLGRYLYDLPSVWVEFDPQRKRITDVGQKELDNRYRSWYAKTMAQQRLLTNAALTADNSASAVNSQQSAVAVDNDVPFDKQAQPEDIDGLLNEFNRLGQELYGDNWGDVCLRNVKRISGGQLKYVDELSAEQIQKLVDGMWKLQEKRLAEREQQVAEAA